jgi:hypothetical protein
MSDLKELFRKEFNNPDTPMGQQFSYLQDMNRVPSIDMDYLPLGVNGNYRAWDHAIKLSPLADNPKNTLSHELQHAVSNIMDGQRYSIKRDKWKPTPEEQRFVEAFAKLNEPTKLPLGELSRYRQSPSEAKAFGVGNSNYPYSGAFEGTPHLDSTMATEQAILLDLAKRALKSNNAPAKEAPKTDPIDDMINAGSDKLKQLGTWASKYFQK